MSTRGLTLIKRAGLVFGVVCILAVAMFLVADYTSVTEQEVYSWIEADIPLGSTKDEVIAFCEDRSISHSAYYKSGQYYEKNRTISASVKNKFSFVVQSGVYINFEFDESDKLISYDAERIFTFL